MSEMIRVALLGGGKMALQHAAAILQCRGARLVAVADPHLPPEELKSRFNAGIAAFTDVQAMLDEIRPDVVHVVTPPDTHASLAKQCLDSGAHVYVEKPFAPTVAEAESVLKFAESKGLKVCAAHQVLFQEAGRRYGRHLPMIGEIVHVESFFSFRPVRRRAGGGGLSSPVEQLIDILPHPVYLLLHALRSSRGGPAVITALDVSIDGEVRAVIRRGNALAMLVVSLRARPVESWLRVMGANGMVEADFVLGNLIRHPGPGASAISVVLKPFSRAWQTGWGSLKAVLKLVFRRHKSYPGLAELLQDFYAAIREQVALPIGPAEILETVQICEAIAGRLRADEFLVNEQAKSELHARECGLSPFNNRGTVLLTGGSGTLGSPTAVLLRDHGWRVRIPVRRNLPVTQLLPGLEYVRADLADSVPDALLDGVEVVVHLAAETAGTKSDHERNTIAATRHLLDAMRRCGTPRLVNISSVAVLKPARFGRRLTESSTVDLDNLSRGPYVWAKAEAERLAQMAAENSALDLVTIRLGPLLDFDQFTPPGRLGREVGRIFVAMGRPSNILAVCGITTAARAIRNCVERTDGLPSTVNLAEVPEPTRGQLIRQLQQARPDLVVIWLPFWILRILSLMLRVTLKAIHPRKPALDLYAAFKSERYDNVFAQELLRDP